MNKPTEEPIKRSIDVIQYLRPKGKRLLVTVDVSEKSYDKYTQIIELGLQVTVEQFSSGSVSLAIEDAKRGDFMMELSENKNNKETLISLEKLLGGFSKSRYEQWVNDWHRNV